MPSAIIVHGGAGAIPPELSEVYQAGCKEAALIGWRILQAGGAALDAVEAAVRSLEDNPYYNAGTGAGPTEEGKVELDAGMMDGYRLDVGAVADVERIKNPISLARKVLESPHVLLVGRMPEKHGTVGAVALDDLGRLAAATSTGGILNKYPGRVGDTPLVGCGFYADENAAISCTGHGEDFIRLLIAKRQGSGSSYSRTRR